jgi:hypothetical protein
VNGSSKAILLDKSTTEHESDSTPSMALPGSGRTRHDSAFVGSLFRKFADILWCRVRPTRTDDDRVYMSRVFILKTMNKRSCHHVSPFADPTLQSS